MSYSNITALEVLPAYDLDGSTYYSTLGTGFSGSVDDVAHTGDITFTQPGPYSVRTTLVDGSQEYFYYGVSYLDASDGSNPPPKAAPYKRTTTPSPDIVIVDSNDYQAKNANPPPPETVTENLKNSTPVFGSSTTKLEKSAWTDVLDYLKGLPAGAKKHVELHAHGSEGGGKLYWGEALVLDSTSLSQLNDLKGKVSNLTFMSCYVGSDAAFIQSVANKLGASSGYTTRVGGNGTHWFIWDNGTLVSKTIPEPNTLVLTVCGLLSLCVLRRRSGGRP